MLFLSIRTSVVPSAGAQFSTRGERIGNRKNSFFFLFEVSTRYFRSQPFSGILSCSVGIFLGVKYASFFHADLSLTPCFGHAVFLLPCQHIHLLATYAGKMCRSIVHFCTAVVLRKRYFPDTYTPKNSI